MDSIQLQNSSKECESHMSKNVLVFTYSDSKQHNV